MKIILYCLFFISLSSCDPGMRLNIIVNNKTLENINLKIGMRSMYIDSIIPIKANQNIIIIDSDFRRKLKSYNCCPCEFFELHGYTSDSTKILTKDYKDKDNWILNKDKKNNTAECIFEINEGDLE
jgi:hypothetical protein